jgi:hypothetical protein
VLRLAIRLLLAVVMTATAWSAAPVTSAENPRRRPGPYLYSDIIETNAQYVLRTIPLRNSTGQMVRLRNYHHATNVTLRQLAAFVRTNPVNLAVFNPGKFVCTEFAQALHNAAETAGLRAGVVMVDFTKGEGHVLNAFETTDQGLVYVDCTGALTGRAPRAVYDTIGYLKVGRVYGRLPLELGLPDPTNYQRFVQVERLWAQIEKDQPQLDRDAAQWQADWRALQAAEKGLGRPPPPSERQAEAEKLRRQREELAQRDADLRARRNDLRRRQQTWGYRFSHSNTNAVSRFKTWW